MFRAMHLSWLCIAAIILNASYATAHWIAPTDAPVDRLVRNLGAYIKEHPDDPQGYYNLARVHSLAFTLRTKSLRAYERGNLPRPADEDRQSVRKSQPKRTEHEDKAPSSRQEESPTDLELLTHLNEAVKNYNQAIAVDGKNGLYYLSFGSLLEAGESLSSKCWNTPLNFRGGIDEWRDAATRIVGRLGVGDRGISEAEQIITAAGRDWFAAEYRALVAALHDAQFDKDENRRRAVRRLLDTHWKEAVTDCYFEAFTLALPDDSKRRQLGLEGLRAFVSYEAAQAYLRVVNARTVRDQDKIRVQTATAAVAALKKLPPSTLITPIIFSMASSGSVSQLLSPRATVAFDLDGTGRPQRWGWVRPETGILVWAPSGPGTITSGRQLFGSVTWWMFWENGYRALDALDDNRDGKLSGDELTGLAVWFDQNSNGVSDAGEVIPVVNLGISAIACRDTTQSEGCPTNFEGLTLTDGTSLPTYDWVIARADEDDCLLSVSAPSFQPLLSSARTELAPTFPRSPTTSRMDQWAASR